jgi:hypothetical protein
MSWGKGLIIFLGLMQLSHVAHARNIESFTDSRSILHITNAGSKPQVSPANPPSPAEPLRPGSLPGKAPIALPASEPGPQAQAPVLRRNRQGEFLVSSPAGPSHGNRPLSVSIMRTSAQGDAPETRQGPEKRV